MDAVNGADFYIGVDGGVISNCLVARNYRSGAAGGGPAVTVGGAAVMENCTIVTNTLNAGSGVVSAGSTATVRNSVIAGNVGRDGVLYPAYTGTAAAFVRCAGDGDEEINENCYLGTPATFFTDFAALNYTPFVGSVLENRGQMPVVAASADLAGNPRVIGRIDIGAFECQRLPGLRIFFR